MIPEMLEEIEADIEELKICFTKVIKIIDLIFG